MRTIKNGKKITKEELVIALLKSERSAAERNFEKLFNNNTDDDDKIRDKICDINIIFSRLGNIVTYKDRKKITKELYEIEKKDPFRQEKKKRFMIILLN